MRGTMELEGHWKSKFEAGVKELGVLDGCLAFYDNGERFEYHNSHIDWLWCQFVTLQISQLMGAINAH